MTVLSMEAHCAVGINFQIRKDGGNQPADAHNVGRPAEEIFIAEAITPAEPRHRWWRLVWPFISFTAVTTLRWLLRTHGIG